MARQRKSNGNARRPFLLARGGKHAPRASIAAMYAAAQAAPVDTRNAEVVVRLGDRESSSSSSDSDSTSCSGASSEPYGEPSPPKSVPKPWSSFHGGCEAMLYAEADIAALFSIPTAANVVIHENNKPPKSDFSTNKRLTSTLGATTRRSEFSPAASRVSFFNSFCTTEGTASLNSSASSMKVGAATARQVDDGKLSIDHLSTSAPSHAEKTSEETSALPPKLTFTFKTVPDEVSAQTKPEPNPDLNCTTSAGMRGFPRASSDIFHPRLPTVPSFGLAPLSVDVCPSASPSGRPTTPPFTLAAPSPFSFSSPQAFSTAAARSPYPGTRTPSSKHAASANGSKHVRFSFEHGPNGTRSSVAQDASGQVVARSRETREETKPIVQSAPSTTHDSPTCESKSSNQHTPIAVAPSLPSFPIGGCLFGAPARGEAPEVGTSFTCASSGDSATSSAFKIPRLPAFSAYTNLTSVALEISDASRIAYGKSGTIYQTRSGVSKLAIKVSNRPVSEKAKVRFERELVKLRNLPEHPYLVQHHGYVALAGVDKIGVITDLVIGSQTWHSRLYSAIRLLDEKEKHRILLQILDAVAFLHLHDVTHRDLSLRHVLHVYGSSSTAIKLIDFGLPTLRAAASSSGATVGGSMGATPQYASPEVLRGELSCHDEDGWKQSDIFSFAVLMVELLTEELPWDGESPAYVLNAVNQRGKRAFQVGDVRLYGKRSPELETAIELAWHQDPFSRPTAEELRKTLGPLFTCPQNSEPPQAVSKQPVNGKGDVEEAKARSAAFHFPGSASPSESQGSSSFSFKVTLPGSLEAHEAAPSVPKPASSLSATASATQPVFGLSSLFESSSFCSASASSRPALSSLVLTVSKETLVAQGNRGAIYRGNCHAGDVAVKVVKKPTSQRGCTRLDKEMLALKNLPDHPYLVRHQGSTPLGDGKCGIVTDFVFAAESIDARLRRTPHLIKEEDKHRMLLQLIDALAYLHAHGITHRDLSWKHVLKTYDSPPTIKLVDFGLPTLRGSATCSAASPAFAMMGFTLEYASPEALRGELSNREVDDWERCHGGWATKKDCSLAHKPGWRESDVYSFVVLMAEMLLEQRPWENESPMYVLNAVAKQGKRPFKVEDVRLFGEKSPTLEALIQEAWHENPLKRPSALELKARLERIFKSD